MRDARTTFRFVYDYGMGGLWGYMSAPSAAHIGARYPELLVDPEPFTWMSEAEFDAMFEQEPYDIDDAPRGIIKAVIADRAKK